MERPVIDMQTHFDVDETMDELVQKRFAMPPAVVATFRQAAALGAARLLGIVADDAKFSKLRVQDQVRVLELIFDRAYGKNETASSRALTEAKVGGGAKSDHSDSLDAIAQRMAKRKGLPSPESFDGEADVQASAIGSMDVFPELRKRAQAANVVKLPRRPI